MRRRTLIALVVAGLSLVACGGDDDNESNGSASSNPAAVARADAKAKANARVTVTGLETCFVDQQTYVDCPVDAPRTEASVDDTSYEVVAKSTSGASFKIAKDASGEFSRACSPAGEGGCKAGGKW